MSKKTLVIVLAVAVSLSAVGWLVWDNYEDFINIANNVRLKYLWGAVALSACAYCFMGLSLWEVLRNLEHKINAGASISIAFVSSTVNYVISTMGASGFALRAHLLSKRGVPFGACVTSSVVITVLLYMTLAVLVLLGSCFMMIKSQGSKIEIMEGFAGVVVLTGICVAFGVVFFDHELRGKWVRKVFRGLNHLIHYFSGGRIPHEDFLRFEKQLEYGMRTIHEHKHKLALAVIFVCADWACTIGVLSMGFKAVGVSVSVGELVAGFAIGMVTTIIPILPGGLGAMELAMTAAYAKFGIEWHAALVASLIFRMAYYILPTLLSIFVYWGLKLSEPLDLREELALEEKAIKEGKLDDLSS